MHFFRLFLGENQVSGKESFLPRSKKIAGNLPKIFYFCPILPAVWSVLVMALYPAGTIFELFEKKGVFFQKKGDFFEKIIRMNFLGCLLSIWMKKPQKTDFSRPNRFFY